MEFALLFHSIAGWLLPRPKGKIFTSRRDDDNAVFVAIAILICLEAIPVHFLVHNYSVLAAWILTGLSVYSLMWVVGEMAARWQRPTVLTGDWLRVCHGLRSEVVVRLSNLSSVKRIVDEVPEARVGNDCQLLLRLTKPVTVYRWFGSERQASTLGVSVDDPEGLMAELVRLGVPVEE